jgi:hypothetical protein
VVLVVPKPPLGGPGDLGQVIQFGDHPKKRGLQTNCRPLDFFQKFLLQKAPSGEVARGTPWNEKNAPTGTRRMWGKEDQSALSKSGDRKLETEKGAPLT